MSWFSKLFGNKKTERGETQQVQPAASTGDDYAAKCLVENYKEQDESRSWDSDPVFRKVLDPLNAGQNTKARDEAKALSQKFPDFADVYVWCVGDTESGPNSDILGQAGVGMRMEHCLDFPVKGRAESVR